MADFPPPPSFTMSEAVLYGVRVRTRLQVCAGREEDLMTEEQMATWLKQAARGDQVACRELYQHFHGAVRRLVAGFAALGPAEVEDVVQETFVRAFRSLSRLQHPHAFSRWLHSIARHHALAVSHSTRTREQVRDALAHEVEPAIPALPEALQLERRVAVVRALIEELPEGPEKQTAHLFYVEGTQSAREIAEHLGLGKSAVTMRLERFRARVKRELLARLLAAEVG